MKSKKYDSGSGEEDYHQAATLSMHSMWVCHVKSQQESFSCVNRKRVHELSIYITNILSRIFSIQRSIFLYSCGIIINQGLQFDVLRL